MSYKPTFNEQRLATNVLTVASGDLTETDTSDDLYVGGFTELAVDLDVTAVSGTSPTITITIERKGADGVYYTVYTGSAVSATGTQSTTIGVGAETNKSFGSWIRVTQTLGGSATPTVTRSLSIIGK